MKLKTLYIKTYGCQMNIYDSGKMIALLKHHGYQLVKTPNLASLIILNTCHIREKATEKIYSELGRLPKNTTIIVAGCVAQAEGEEIIKRNSNVNIVVGPQSYYKIPILLEKLRRNKKEQISLEFEENTKFDKIKTTYQSKYSTFLTIQEGCDKFCNFCCVPYTRGQEFSRPPKDIIKEAYNMVEKGAKEITLLGQNVSAYYNQYTFSQLLKEITKISHLSRIRYVTSHPVDIINSDLFDVHAKERKIMPQLHLPVQSGSNKILKAMNRKHSIEDYLYIIKKFLEVRPDMMFSSDFIVGYPGETEKDFENTINLVNKVKFSQSYAFKYSIRPGTPAATLSQQVDESIKSKRLQKLQNILQQKQIDINNNFVGSNMPVLFYKRGKKTGQILGKTPYMQSVIVEESESIIGKICNTAIDGSNYLYLKGRIIKQEP